MGKDLVPVQPASEEISVEWIALDDLSAVEGESVVTPLEAADEEALELGIASVFDSILMGESDIETPLFASNEDATFMLLEELNRIWAQAA